MGEGYGAFQWGGGEVSCREGVRQSDDSLCRICNHSKYCIEICNGFKTIQQNFRMYEKTDFSTTVIFCSITFQSQYMVI